VPRRAATGMPRPILLTAGLVAGIGAAVLATVSVGGNIDGWVEQAARALTDLRVWVAANHLAAIGIYFGSYVVMAAISMPGAIWLSILAGFLFGVEEGVVLATISATVGATCAYLMGRHVFTRWIQLRAGKYMSAIKSGFKQDAFHYLLVLRLMPGCPFVVVNLAVAALDMKLSTYILATLVGVFPSTVAHVLIGVGLREVIALRGNITLADFALNPSVVAGLVGAAVVAALPIVYRRLWKKSPA